MPFIAPLIASCLVYAGTSTGHTNQGVYVARMNPDSGALTPFTLAATTTNPSFVAADPKHDLLFTVNEMTGKGNQPGGRVSTFTIHPDTGALTWLSSQSSRGNAPCYLSLDSQATHVLVANYMSGNVAVLPVGLDGRLAPASGFAQHSGHGLNPDRQEGPHAHYITLDAANHFAYACDLGLDKILIYRYDAGTGTLVTNTPPFKLLKPGTGPRHFTLSPDGRHAYVVSELANTVTLFACNPADGSLTEQQTFPTVPASFTGTNYPAEIEIHPSGKFLYVSNRGYNSFIVFAINPADGTLTQLQDQPALGKWPRQFAIDPAGKFLLAANQLSGTIVEFKIDPETGRLTPTGQSQPVPVPTCVAFFPE